VELRDDPAFARSTAELLMLDRLLKNELAGSDSAVNAAFDKAGVLRAAGAETIVMGSLAFGAQDFSARIAWLRGLPGP
jgi:hypothetical protein